MKKIKIIIVVVLLIAIGLSIFFVLKDKVGTKNYQNSNFKVSYDTTWEVKNDKDELYLIHKKTKSELKIQCKLLDSNFIDTNLRDIIDDIIYSIENQNDGYVLINRSDNVSDKYESYSYLYENNEKQVLVNLYKKDAKLIVVYYEAESKYYDIVLDSVNIILDSLEVVFE